MPHRAQSQSRVSPAARPPAPRKRRTPPKPRMCPHDRAGRCNSGHVTRSSKRKRRKPLEAPEALEGLLARAGDARLAPHQPPIAVREWRRIVGLRIAEKTQPVSLDKGVLTIRTTTSAWAHELQMLAPELLQRLQGAGVSVRQLRFRVGPLQSTSLADRPPERRIARQVPAPVALGAALLSQLADVADDELRAMMQKAASANLAWQRNAPRAPDSLRSTPRSLPPSAGDPSAARRASR